MMGFTFVLISTAFNSI